ncbi:MAG: hypothetical protein ACRCYO_20325 [Bacteroidia bacterium]
MAKIFYEYANHFIAKNSTGYSLKTNWTLFSLENYEICTYITLIYIRFFIYKPRKMFAKTHRKKCIFIMLFMFMLFTACHFTKTPTEKEMLSTDETQKLADSINQNLQEAKQAIDSGLSRLDKK